MQIPHDVYQYSIVGHGLFGLIINVIVSVVISQKTQLVSQDSVTQYHNMYAAHMTDNVSTDDEVSVRIVPQK
ncbi:hypothetical protein [Photobacterium sp. 1_MG-2023]|uniref:hypothetical protein n=1 Tax=Photobacterium sp. 1_MG-2023 TaxID=3062646 RepID=UPI0026E41742|nr:hypothetical protein [Photobacterium sp. 1_MG-2023]MDO6707352.1 hypothetical protein [Photobacterium sp. 1_MG-2023]